jgi:hypothetical protein
VFLVILMRVLLILGCLSLFVQATEDAEAKPRKPLAAALLANLRPVLWEYQDLRAIGAYCDTVTYVRWRGVAGGESLCSVRVIDDNDERHWYAWQVLWHSPNVGDGCPPRRMFEDASGTFRWRGNCAYVTPLDW